MRGMWASFGKIFGGGNVEKSKFGASDIPGGRLQPGARHP